MVFEDPLQLRHVANEDFSNALFAGRRLCATDVDDTPEMPVEWSGSADGPKQSKPANHEERTQPEETLHRSIQKTRQTILAVELILTENITGLERHTVSNGHSDEAKLRREVEHLGAGFCVNLLVHPTRIHGDGITALQQPVEHVMVHGSGTV